MLAGALILQVILWIMLPFQIRPQEDPIFLHYTILFGVDYTGNWVRIFVVPGIGLTVLLVNGLLGWLLFQRDRFAAYVLCAVALLSQIFLMIAAWILIFLNV